MDHEALIYRYYAGFPGQQYVSLNKELTHNTISLTNYYLILMIALIALSGGYNG